MNKLNRIIVRALGIILGVGFASMSGTFAATHTVNIGDNFFSPPSLTIQRGDTVTWVNIGVRTHNSRSTTGVWSSPPGNIQPGQSFSFTFNVTPGNYPYVCTLHAGQSGTIIVQAPPNQPPTVNITSPSAGATFTAPASVTITATASDPDGSVASVEFFDGGTSLGVDSSSPYSVTATLQAGTHNLTAKATDNAGAPTTSAAVQVTVNAALASARLSNPQRLPDGKFQFTIEGVSGGRYEIHATGALPGGWSILETVTAPSATFNYIDQASAGIQRRFYRTATVP